MAFLRIASTLLLSSALAQAKQPVRSPKHYPLTGQKKLIHVLDRLTYGPKPGDLEQLKKIGIAAFIQQQLHPESIPDVECDKALAAYPTLLMSSYELSQTYPNAKPGQTMMKNPHAILDDLWAAKLTRAVISQRQLEEIMVDFWFNHFNVYFYKDQDKWLMTSYERDVIRPHALGKFRDLLGAVAHSPAMMVYLDNYQSTVDERYAPVGAREDIEEMESHMAANPKGRHKLGLNENYGRELMELHTLGVDGGYTQKDVTELARILTGWSIDQPRPNNQLKDYSFQFKYRMHDPGTKVLLGHAFVWEGEPEGEKALDLLARSPATARFIATKLCRRFVADNPPKTLVARVARKFQTSGGDIRQTLLTLFRSPEFYDSAYFHAKVKTPFEFMISALRATGAQINDPLKIGHQIERMGEPLYLCEPPTGYPDQANAWVSSGALLLRMQFAQGIFNHNPNAPASADPNAPLADVDFSRSSDIVQAFVRAYLGGQISERTRSAILERLDHPEISKTDAHGGRHYNVHNLAVLVLGSPDFQRK